MGRMEAVQHGEMQLRGIGKEGRGEDGKEGRGVVNLGLDGLVWNTDWYPILIRTTLP